MPTIQIYVREATWKRINSKPHVLYDRTKALKEIHDAIENSFP
jgi:hypothetical protein